MFTHVKFVGLVQLKQKKNLNKKTYKIPFIYNKEECKVEIIYQNSQRKFVKEDNVNSNEMFRTPINLLV